MPEPITTGLMLGGSILGGVLGLGESPQEREASRIIKSLEESEEYFKETPFSKEEIMQELLPQVQEIYRGASDVAAGRLGASIGEAGIPGGQATAEYYTQALAPVLAKGEFQAGQAVSEFGQWYSKLDAQAKRRFLDSMRLQLQATQQLPEMGEMERVITGALSGLNLGTSAAGNIAQAGALNTKADMLGSLGQTGTQTGSQGFDIMGDSINLLQGGK